MEAFCLRQMEKKKENKTCFFLPLKGSRNIVMRVMGYVSASYGSSLSHDDGGDDPMTFMTMTLVTMVRKG